MANTDTNTTHCVVCNFKERATAPELQAAVVEALAKGLGEVHCVVECDGKQHFTSLMLDQLFDLVQKSAVNMAGSINRTIKKSSASRITRTNAMISKV